VRFSSDLNRGVAETLWRREGEEEINRERREKGAKEIRTLVGQAGAVRVM
jgi:hypothetical protein